MYGFGVHKAVEKKIYILIFQPAESQFFDSTQTLGLPTTKLLHSTFWEEINEFSLTQVTEKFLNSIGQS